jgi:Mg2+ and Co2+ transporter CorA
VSVTSVPKHACLTIHRDHIVDAYKPPIDQIKAEVDAVEDLVYTPDVDDMRAFTRRISDLQHRTDSCIRLLSGKRNILRTFSKHHSYTGDGADDSSIIEKEDTRSIVHITSYIDDVEDHVETHLQDLKFMNSVLSRSQENYIIGQDILSINGRRRIGTFLKFVGFLGLGFTMMLWVCGMFSMNVNANIPLYSRNTITAWLLIIGGCLLGGVIMVIIGRRIRWF